MQLLGAHEHAGRDDLGQRRPAVLPGVTGPAPPAAVVGHQGHTGGPARRPGPAGREGHLEVVHRLAHRGEQRQRAPPAGTLPFDTSEVGGHVAVIAREQDGAPRFARLVEQGAEGRDVLHAPAVSQRGVALERIVDGVDDDRDDPPGRIAHEAQRLFRRAAALGVALGAEQQVGVSVPEKKRAITA
ncbi:MAG: hypothetical protein U0359_09440 [Byssovorax sp.]